MVVAAPMAWPWPPSVGLAGLLLLAPLLHSLVDFPLRTLALATLFTLLAAQLLAAKREVVADRLSAGFADRRSRHAHPSGRCRHRRSSTRPVRRR